MFLKQIEHLPNLQGSNVCDYHERIDPIPKQPINENHTESTRLVRNCCAGYESLDARTCTSKMDFLNPFKDSDNFSLALICLAVLLLAVGMLSMFIAYRYYYRYRIGRKPAGILTEEDMNEHEDNFVIGFTSMSPHHLDENPYKPIVVR